jgi:hypothetical protein
MKLKVAFYLLALVVAYLFLSDVLKDHYPVQASVAMTLFNPVTWVFLIVAVFMARRRVMQ